MRTEKIRLEYMDIKKIKENPKNPKGHSVGLIIKSINTFGFVSPMIIDETSGELVVGHGRLEALREIIASGNALPANIKKEKNKILVPVVRGYYFEERERHAYMLADNRLTEIGKWEPEDLDVLLKELNGDYNINEIWPDFNMDLFQAFDMKNPDYGDIMETSPPDKAAKPGFHLDHIDCPHCGASIKKCPECQGELFGGGE